MKMKEKKEDVVEEVVEEVVEKNEQMIKYLEFARDCVYQYAFFLKAGKICFQIDKAETDRVYESLGLDISRPVTVRTNFSKETVYDDFCTFLGEWINAYNDLDLSKVDNYTKYIIEMDLPNPYDVIALKQKFKKCD